ncbi:sperm-egg fusion protein TMEM95 isoform X6 [Oryctolagus cuniculus]|uniref:sperm-egg fusion protein TMEM95 isoform X6 n=1 Tax=Oryctolagus cuniculus TaxID=9986 RepID=UPI002231A861|nr:sperm-egg fusion protein TMEM95 isoform X6 [Oryctolagus cuniculus]
MRSLALAGVFLAATQACIFCRLPDRDLSGRLARLCSQMEAQWKEWASPDFSAFALDEVTMNKVTEKTHRVLRVIEDPDPPVHQGSSLCSGLPSAEVSCWPRKRCSPGSHDLWEARILLLCVSGAALLLGVLSLLVESRHLRAGR